MNNQAESKVTAEDIKFLDQYHEAIRLFKDIYREAIRACRVRLTIEEILLRRARGPQC